MWASKKNEAFKYLKDRIWMGVQGWMEKLLASGGTCNTYLLYVLF
jgi:hypothetical protein